MYERFELLLKEFNVTAYKVAKETNVARSTLTNWKQGNYTPKMEKIKRIAAYFHVSAEWLLGSDVPRTPYEVVDKESGMALTPSNMQNLPNVLQYAIGLLENGETVLVNEKVLNDEIKEKLCEVLKSCSKEVNEIYNSLS